MNRLIAVKNQLQGDSFRALLKKENTNKYRVAKETGISYVTLCYWQSEKSYPSDELAEIVGRHLGLISKKRHLQKLKDEIVKRQKRVDELEKEK